VGSPGTTDVSSIDEPGVGFPPEWESARLGDIARVRYGKPKPNASGKIPVIGSGGIYSNTQTALVDFPTVVIGRKGTAGEVWLADTPCWPSDTTFYLEWRKEANPYFIFNFLRLNKPSGEHAKTTLPSLQRADLEQMVIPQPSEGEQRRIAKVLSTIQQATNAQDKVIAAAQELKRSLMEHLFTYGPVPVTETFRVPLKETELGLVPEHWALVGLGDFAKVGNGSTPKRTNPAYWEGGVIPWLTSAKVHETFIHQADEYVTELARTKCHLPLVKKGSIVVAITGQGKTLGNAALVTFDTRVSQHLAYISFQSNKFIPEFVLAFLQRQYQDLRRLSQGGGTTKGALTCALLKQYRVPMPAPEEQESIAGGVRAIGHKIEAERKRNAALQALFKTMLHHLMTGKIRVRDADG
jgi:type I restriction enzyme S subunit